MNGDMGDSLQLLNVDTLNAKLLITDSICRNSEDFGAYTFARYSCELFGNGMISVTISVILMITLVGIFYKKEQALTFCGRYLSQGFVLAWIMGFVVYDIGMYHDQSITWSSAFWSMLGVAPMAIIHAFEMFLFQSDISAINVECQSNSWYMFFFSLAHFLAAFISLIFVIRHFGFNIVASIIRLWKTLINVGKIEKLYVFWGMNDATYTLAKNMINIGKLNDGKVIIIRNPNERENTNGPLGLERLFSFLSLTTINLENLQELQKHGCLTSSSFGSLINIQASNNNEILNKELRLNSLIRLIQHTTKEIHMFFLGDNEVFNIQAVANLRRDKELQAFANKEGDNIRVKFYCHARYNSIHRVIEDELAAEKMRVKVVDSSHISVELLKKKTEVHPVRYVNIEKDATVSSPFNALVVGFGEVGMDAVRFLYEFGAFVKHKDWEGSIERSAFHCHVVDQEMDTLAGLFTVNAPSIATTLNRKELDVSKALNLYKMDCRSVEFYNRLDEWVKTLNYVVVATGDDEINISLAIRIFRLAIRYRENGLKQFRILVRIQHDENGHIQKISEHYNRLWAADERSTNDHLHQCEIQSTALMDSPIMLFGSIDQVYTYDNVVNEALINDAKTFKDKYDKSFGNSPLMNWEEEEKDLRQLTEKYKGYAPTFSGLMKLRRSQSQNIANSLHKETKKWLAQMALDTDCYEEMKKIGIVRNENATTYSWCKASELPINKIQRVMDVLAQTEHLRWNASHEILGYQMGMDNDGFKEEAKLLHGCLKNWEQLSNETKCRDYNTVDISLD